MAGFLEKMTIEEAREILDIRGEISDEDVKRRYKEIMLINHPDHGGSEYLA